MSNEHLDLWIWSLWENLPGNVDLKIIGREMATEDVQVDEPK